jgi:hypothetical protein
VFRKEAVDRIGLAELEALNRGSGGVVTPPSSSVSSDTRSSTMQIVQNIYTVDPIQAAGESARRLRAVGLALTRRG